MTDIPSIISTAQKTIENEYIALQKLIPLIDTEFAEAVQFIYHSKGRVIVSGVGKSAIIASKIVATLNSTGTPAIFMHAADAIHGDLGIIQKDDVVICLSKSGNTPEIKVLIPLLKAGNNKLVAITANRDSYLGQQSDFVLHAYIDKEACPHNLAPTTSTTTQMVMGDALAICLLEMKGFTSDDFARYHPGGALGKKLYLRVKDIAIGNLVPKVSPETSIKEAIVEISEKMLGATAVLENNKIIGIITDGDIRRMLSKYDNIGQLKARDIMSANPKRIEADTMAVDALEIMEKNDISQLLVEKDGSYMGVIHLHDLIKEGIL